MKCYRGLWVEINDQFDGGSIDCVSVNAQTARLRLRSDRNAEFFQWFWFQIRDVRGNPIHIELDIRNASFGGLTDYSPFIRSPSGNWERRSALTRNGVLYLTLPQSIGWTDIAYFQPYTWSDYRNFADGLQLETSARIDQLGSSIEGRSIDRIRIEGTASKGKAVWVTARQHPGEVMGSHFIEGLIGEAIRYRQNGRLNIDLNIVPMVNPDGVCHGNIRTNAAGVDLNRAWNASPSIDAPEVAAIIRSMEQHKPILFLDVHGVEDMDCCFLQPPEGDFGQTIELRATFEAFESDLIARTPHIQNQQRFAYSGDPAIASNWTTEKFGCLGVTLEMPFARIIDGEKSLQWTATLSRSLGEETMRSIIAVLSAGQGVTS